MSWQQKTGAFLVALLAIGWLGHDALAQTWQPPIGIPPPPFGIDEAAPALPSPWESNVAGFYFVADGGSNDGNGYPGNARATVPTTLPAGSVVIISGTYDVSHELRDITANGTSDEPVFIRGLSASERATITQKWQVGGSYYILEHINAVWTNASYNGKLLLHGQHGVVRHTELAGDTNTGVGGIHPHGSYLVIYDNYIHDCGDVNAVDDVDTHCISVGPGNDHLWVVDNEITRSSGDGMQINGTLESIHHVYFGRNVSHHNKQSGMWTKAASDVIFSQNLVYDFVPSGSSPDGPCTGGQYGPDYVWWLFNEVHDCDTGIRLQGDSSYGAETPHRFIIGNLIHDIRDSGNPNPDRADGNGAIVLRGGQFYHIVHNTMWNYQAGLMTNDTNIMQIQGNILGNRTNPDARDLFVTESATANDSTFRNNVLFGDPVRISWSSSGGTVYDLEEFQSATGKGQDCVNADPEFASDEFSLTSGSPGLDTALDSDAYEIFETRYGIDIRRDIRGAPRPLGTGWDMGAYEYADQPECGDGVDNDGDGQTDYPDDDGCDSADDADESDCGDGECEGGETCTSCENDCGTCTTCSDNDGDGYGDPATNCTHAEVDCDDSDAEVNPGASELCNGADDDCDGETDEPWTSELGASCSVGVGACLATGTPVCSADGTTVTCDAAAGAGSAEICDNDVDEDCDGTLDNGCSCTIGAQRDCYAGPIATANVGACTTGTQSCAGGTWGRCEGQVLPTTEVCSDAIDNDCDGDEDEGCGDENTSADNGDDETMPIGGCGCADARTDGWGWGLMALVLFVRRRGVGRQKPIQA